MPQKRAKKLPHEGVWTRIRRSPIHGVGVFAIRPIPKDTFIFPDDTAPFSNVMKNRIKGMRGELRALYDDFCVARGNILKGPSSFNRLTVAWYLNEPAKGRDPNVACRKNYTFYALRQIAKGEELTVDYSTYSEPQSPHKRRASNQLNLILGRTKMRSR